MNNEGLTPNNPNNPMNKKSIKRIRQSMEAKSTEELLKIWEEMDTEQWSPEAFDVVKQLLEERGATFTAKKIISKYANDDNGKHPSQQKKPKEKLSSIYFWPGSFFCILAYWGVGPLKCSPELVPRELFWLRL